MIIEDARNVDNISGEKGGKKENEKGKLNSKKKTSSLHSNEGPIESIEMDSRLLSALLTIIEIRLPSFFDNFDPCAGASNFPSSVQAYLAGLTFALAASPCTTPVLATLLGYVAASRDAVIGGSLLLTYTTGYVAPLLVAASFAGALKVLYWLSGLTCNDENFIIKSGAQRAAASEGVALVAPDTSPRGLNVEGEADSRDFGVGAGFYLNATQEKWKNWRMYDYVINELPKVLAENFEQLDTSRASISGHSMGGHGALTIYLKNPDKYKSVSAFAPIVNSLNCPWGQKAFSNYLGSSNSDWEDYDATCLVE